MNNELDLKNTIKNIKKSWKYAKDNKKELIIFLILSLVVCSIGVITPMIAAKMLIKLTDGLFQPLGILAITLFILEVVRNLFSFLASKIDQIICNNILVNIQVKVAQETLKLETKELDLKSSGVFADRIGKDTYDIANIFVDVTYAIADVAANIGVLLAVLIISKIMFLYSLAAMIAIFLAERIRLNKYYSLDKKWRKLNEKNTGFITELVRGIRDIKVLNAEELFVQKTKHKVEESSYKKYQMRDILIRYKFWINNIKDFCGLGYVFIGIFLTVNKTITIPIFVMLYSYKNKVLNLLNYVVNLFELTKKFNVSASRIFTVIDGNEFEKEKFGNTHLDKIEGNFEFKNVTFGYDDKDVLNNLSFKIKPNETIAFVGKSGGGKTTIFSLINKLYTVKDGKILIDNVDINRLDKDSIRNNISVITQNPYIFNFSIKENLKLVKAEVTDEEIKKACHLACLDDYIESLPDKYDTVVGEGGITMSGGQKQRLAIARALIRKTKIILFDEATSALDNQTQYDIQKSINNLKGDYTILIIAHRLSTVINSDKIFLIDKGQIIAIGTHQELLKSSKLYRQLYITKTI